MEILRAGLTKTKTPFLVQVRKMQLLRNKAYINGEWVSASNKAVFQVLNPADQSVVGEVPDLTVSEAKHAVNVAYDAFKVWREYTAKERSAILRNWYQVCLAHADKIAEVMTAECGKPLAESHGEIVYGNSYLEWFSECARHVNGEVLQSPWRNKQLIITRQPIGVVTVIAPWNFPFAMITRKVGALMAAGCTCIIKPSEETPLTALALTGLAEKAGVPKGVINVVTCSRENVASVGKVLCEETHIACISFTGSTAVGKVLYASAAKGIKRVALELGGNAPFIVLPSADIKNAVDQAMIAKFRNNGQACIGVNRFLVHEDVYDQFVNAFKKAIQERCILGPGNKQGVTCGPLINQEILNKVDRLVNDAVKKGAQVVLGGKVSSIGKLFYEPTLMVNVTTDMDIYNEEIFGPVATIVMIKSEAEALKVANATSTGLASYVCTKDLGQAFRMMKHLDFGMIAINDGLLSTAETAFGGIKESGIGREGSMHGVEEYTDIKYTLFSGLDK